MTGMRGILSKKLKHVSLRGKNLRQKFGTFFKVSLRISRAFLLFAATLMAIISGLLTLQNYDDFSRWFNREFKTEEYWLHAAESLAPEMNVKVFDNTLGEPVFIGEKAGLTGRTYVNKYFYTQVISDDAQRVALFSITIRKDGFHPKIPYLRAETVGKGKGALRLGTFKYTDFTHDLVGLQYIPGGRRSIYSEVYYFGNSGNYLYYILSSNDASSVNALGEIKGGRPVTLEDTGFYDGCNSDDHFPGAQSGRLQYLTTYNLPGLRDLRQKKQPNTISITERGGTFFCKYKDVWKDAELFIFGPDLDKVRLLER